MTACTLYCPVCRCEFDWNQGYGREIRCCCKECHTEAEWRRTLSILGKAYYPDPRRWGVEAGTAEMLHATEKSKNRNARIEAVRECERIARKYSDGCSRIDLTWLGAGAVADRIAARLRELEGEK